MLLRTVSNSWRHECISTAIFQRSNINNKLIYDKFVQIYYVAYIANILIIKCESDQRHKMYIE